MMSVEMLSVTIKSTMLNVVMLNANAESRGAINSTESILVQPTLF